ncbi:TrbG/VirB9 family P-type conjugative transfer protein [Cupriavidus sp. D39]|uniref:TrbG/VirB9 family P-type conjugative transfer protein n=1 Tax=Cupriavidus sp. D39 TaxID=2997877 RepID=UPI0022707DB5|nr:TrbG/VirB9 family P-type conjugative transfer protein [Cupriavidus sp. D39]MCY0852657.1 TrbG/VirB9 family P-type conjugative transfer protein [Cupriavidus sp. D39]
MRNRLSSLAIAGSIALVLSSPLGFAADKVARKGPGGVPPIGVGDIGDAMNPFNPLNGGADPVALPADSRLVVFTYSQDQIFRVLSAPLKTTTIEFPSGETIASEPAWGENVRWSYDTDGINHIYLRPHAPGLVNTLSVNTNKRSYEFTLVSSPLGGMFYQKVRFNVPEPMMPKVKARGGDAAAIGGAEPDQAAQPAVGVSPDKLNFEYSVGGSADFRPDQVFDDGKAIWMRIPKGADWPVALVKDGSDFVVANFIRRGEFLVLQRLAENVVLRSGNAEVTVQRGRRRLLGLF